MKKKNSKEPADFPGRFGALTWRPGVLMKNLETPGKTGRVDRYGGLLSRRCLSGMTIRWKLFLVNNIYLLVNGWFKNSVEPCTYVILVFSFDQ